MRLLVSVANAEEAVAALAGGADLIDAKEPSSGALGAVTVAVLRDIAAAIDGARPLTAALGDAEDEDRLEQAARMYALAGATLVKIGFAGVSGHARVTQLIRAATLGAARNAGVIAVAYADADSAASPDPRVIVEAAAQAGAAGVLLDTSDKHGPGLRALMTPAALAAWVADARDAGLLVAVAGKLGADDLGFARNAGADIVGVRGAACQGGRTGRVVPEQVRLLRVALRRSAPAPVPDPVAACE